MRHIIFFGFGAGLLLLGVALLCRGLRRRSVPLPPVVTGQASAFGWGLGTTLLLQSSSAVTCMLVPLADSGALPLAPLFWALCGTNLGSSLTGWLFCLPALPLPQRLGPLLWGGMGLWGLARRRPMPLGLGCLFLGLGLMSGAAAPLAALPQTAQLLTHCGHPLFGLWMGILFAGLLQSSSAGMGVLLTLAGTGALSRISACWLVMGLNIGTCATAILAALPAGKRGRTVPAVHLLINLGAMVPVSALLWVLPPAGAAQPWEAALFHTGFNCVVPAATGFALTFLRVRGKLETTNGKGSVHHGKKCLRQMP